VDGHGRNRDDKGDNAGEHDDDEPGRAVFGLRRGLGNTHGVDEGVRDEQEELHLTVQRVRCDSSRNRCIIMLACR
jgi:hypothetical protein